MPRWRRSSRTSPAESARQRGSGVFREHATAWSGPHGPDRHRRRLVSGGTGTQGHEDAVEGPCPGNRGQGKTQLKLLQPVFDLFHRRVDAGGVKVTARRAADSDSADDFLACPDRKAADQRCEFWRVEQRDGGWLLRRCFRSILRCRTAASLTYAPCARRFRSRAGARCRPATTPSGSRTGRPRRQPRCSRSRCWQCSSARDGSKAAGSDPPLQAQRRAQLAFGAVPCLATSVGCSRLRLPCPHPSKLELWSKRFPLLAPLSGQDAGDPYWRPSDGPRRAEGGSRTQPRRTPWLYRRKGRRRPILWPERWDTKMGHLTRLGLTRASRSDIVANFAPATLRRGNT